MRATSRESLRAATEDGSLSRARREVYRALQAHPAGLTGAELDRHMAGGQPVRMHFHKRLSELRATGHAREDGTRTCSVTGHRAIAWCAVDAAGAARDVPARERCHWCDLRPEVGATCARCGTRVVEVVDTVEYGRVLTTTRER